MGSIFLDFLQEDYSQRRRLSTPSGSPSPPQPSRLSRSTGTLTRGEEPYKSTLTRDNQGQEAERKGWFKSLSRKTKSNSKVILTYCSNSNRKNFKIQLNSDEPKFKGLQILFLSLMLRFRRKAVLVFVFLQIQLH